MTSEAPERIWSKEGCNSWGLDGDWWYTASKGDGVEYVRADLVEELEAKLVKALGAMQGVRLLMFEDQHKDAFRLLDSTIAELKGDKT